MKLVQRSTQSHADVPSSGAPTTAGGSRSELRGMPYAAQVQRLSPDRAETATATTPTNPLHAGLITYLADPAKRAALVAGLAKNDPAVVKDFTTRTASVRPLPDEANAVLQEAWDIADKVDPPNMTTLAMLVGLRFGIEVDTPDPAKPSPTDITPFYLREIWKSLGRLPAHHLESTDAKKNAPGYEVDKLEGNEDPVKRLNLRQPKEGEGEGGTTDEGYIALTQSAAGAKTNRFPVATTMVGKSGAIRNNPGTLPQQLSPVPKDETKEQKAAREAKEKQIREDFAKAEITNLSHSILHEWGHRLDRTRGIMDSGAYNLAKWNPQDKSAAKAVAANLGIDGDAKLGASGEKRAELEQKLEDFGPAVVAKADPNKAGGLWEGNATALAAAKASTAGQWLLKQQETSGARAFTLAPMDLGGRVYIHNPGGDSKKWASYDAAYRASHSVSDYQWKTHREWFAECYAAYYDSNPRGALLEARDPDMKAKLDVLHVSSKMPSKK